MRHRERGVSRSRPKRWSGPPPTWLPGIVTTQRVARVSVAHPGLLIFESMWIRAGLTFPRVRAVHLPGLLKRVHAPCSSTLRIAQPIRTRQFAHAAAQGFVPFAADGLQIGVVFDQALAQVRGEAVAAVQQQIQGRADREVGAHGRIEGHKHAFAGFAERGLRGDDAVEDGLAEFALAGLEIGHLRRAFDEVALRVHRNSRGASPRIWPPTMKLPLGSMPLMLFHAPTRIRCLSRSRNSSSRSANDLRGLRSRSGAAWLPQYGREQWVHGDLDCDVDRRRRAMLAVPLRRAIRVSHRMSSDVRIAHRCGVAPCA